MSKIVEGLGYQEPVRVATSEGPFWVPNWFTSQATSDGWVYPTVVGHLSGMPPTDQSAIRRKVADFNPQNLPFFRLV